MSTAARPTSWAGGPLCAFAMVVFAHHTLKQFMARARGPPPLAARAPRAHSSLRARPLRCAVRNPDRKTRKGDWMVSLDLADGFYAIAVHESDGSHR